MNWTSVFGAPVFALLAALAVWAQGVSAVEPGTEKSADRPRVLVTNDDGYATAGIAALAEALAGFADVLVVAPAENQSGASQSTHVFSIDSGIRVSEVQIGESLAGYSVTGSPADSVYAGIALFGDRRPFDLVVSGINMGPNFGEGYFYSGTVGAAFQAASQGIPAIAVSQANKRPEYRTAAEFATRLARELLRRPLPQGVIVSVNVPDGDIKGAVAARPGAGPYKLEFLPGENQGGDSVYWPKVFLDQALPPAHDVKHFMSGYISVTPLQLDRTHTESIVELAKLDFIDLPENE